MMDPLKWSFDIDRYLNPLVPSPPWRFIPYPAARFLGHRKPHDTPIVMGNLATIFWAWIGVFCGIALIGGVTLHIPSYQEHNVPLLIGSFGAAAVLEFLAIDSPFAQPRNAVVGHILSAILGVSICKLMQYSDNFDSLRWLGAALSCATATALMGLTKTVHPPAGATAMLAVAEPRVSSLGWFLVPVVCLGVTFMMTVAIIINNIQRRFPIYWWTPEDLSRKKAAPCDEESNASTITAGGLGGSSSNNAVGRDSTARGDVSVVEEKELDGGADDGSSQNNMAQVILRQGQVVLPDGFPITPEERQILECLCQRL